VHAPLLRLAPRHEEGPLVGGIKDFEIGRHHANQREGPSVQRDGAADERGIGAETIAPNALAEHFDTTRQAVSKHLRILTECELVTQEQKGREIYYSLEIEKMKEIDEWLEQYRKIWETRFEQLGEVLEIMKKQKEEK